VIPIPIPNAAVPDNCRRVVIGPPDGDPTGDVRPVEAVVGVDEQHRLAFAMLVRLEDGELDRLREMPAVWLTMWTHQIPAFALHIADAGEPVPDERRLTERDWSVIRYALEHLAQPFPTVPDGTVEAAATARLKIAEGAR
jgi:hypothetical protein